MNSNPQITAPPASFFDIVDARDRDAARAFYAKYLDINGLPVVAAASVDDVALERTRDMVSGMLAGRPDVLAAMVRDGMYLTIIGRDQKYTDLPENREHPDPDYVNERVRGTGGKPTSFGEENLLSLPLDRYDDESIAVHEFCHTIDAALESLEPDWAARRENAFRAALENGLWKDTYAGSNPFELWAEAGQSFFDCNRTDNWNHGPVGTREELAAYDPATYHWLRETYNLAPDSDWRYRWLQSLPNVSAPPARLGFDAFYLKFTWAREFPIVGRAVPDDALLDANRIVRKTFAYRHDILKALIADGFSLVILGAGETLADVPELRGADLDLSARFLSYDARFRTLVVPAYAETLASSVMRVLAEAFYYATGERAVEPDWDARDPWSVQQYELRVQRLDVTWGERVRELCRAARESRLWPQNLTSDAARYWGNGVATYFDAAATETRESLQARDPQLYELVHQTMAYADKTEWRRVRKHLSE